MPVINPGETVAERNQRLGFGTIAPKETNLVYTSGPKSVTPGQEQILGPLPPPTNPTSSTNNLRQGEEMVKGSAVEGLKSLDAFQKSTTDVLQSIMDFTPYSQSEAGKQAAADLEKVRKSIGIFTDAENRQIEQAGQAEGAKYDPLISNSIEEKRKGLPKAIIGGGERGGFMNTQIAGASAIAPTEGGTFVGEGGELNNIKSVYDRNIDNLRSAKQSAIAQAEAAARAAIVSGKETDYKFFADAFDRAQKVSMDEIALGKEKVDAINAYEKQLQARTVFNQEQEDRQIESSLGALQSQLTGDTVKDIELLQKMATEKGIDPDRLLSSLNEYADKKSKENLSVLSQKFDISKNIPAGEVFYDKESGMSITGTKDPEIVNVIQTIGANEYRYEYKRDPVTGTLTQIGEPINLGPKYKPSSGGSGGGNEDDAKKMVAIQNDAADLIGKYAKGDIVWPEMYDTMKIKHPDMPSDAINEILGGGIPYDAKTNTFDTSAAYGRAKTITK